jgi:hypothetical protein
MAKKSTRKTRKNADRQGTDYEVGYGKPPKETQFQPGQSGNPKGCPPHRANLWPHFCRFLAMSPEQIRKIDRGTLTLAERSALRLAIAESRGKRCGSERLARYAIDRDEGRAVERLILGEDSPLTDERCEELARLLRGAWSEGQEARHDADRNP